MVDFFVQGGGFMWPILIALLFGLAIIGERAYSLLNSSSNTDEFFEDVKTVYNDSGKEQAIELCAIYWHFLLIVWLILFGLMIST